MGGGLYLYYYERYHKKSFRKLFGRREKKVDQRYGS